MSTKSEEILKRIEKDRYLISCKCSICNKSFKDIILGTQHITDEHPKREKNNVIDNLTWDVKDDLKKWEILQELRTKRDEIINMLSDTKAIEGANIPEVVEIQRKKANISGIMSALIADMKKPDEEEAQEEEEEEEEEDIEEELDERDFESSDDDEDTEEDEETSGTKDTNNDIEDDADEETDDEPDDGKGSKKSKGKKRNLCELLEREIEKYSDAIKRLPMASEVEKLIKTKKRNKLRLYKYADQLDYYLGVAKAVSLIKESKIDLEIIL